MFVAAVVCACAPLAPQRTFPSGVEQVYINRTQTPVEVSWGFIEACSERTFTQREIAAANQMKAAGTFSSAPPGSIDLTSIGYEAAADMPKPLVVVILPGGRDTTYVGGVDDEKLPPCEGIAAVPS